MPEEFTEEEMKRLKKLLERDEELVDLLKRDMIAQGVWRYFKQFLVAMGLMGGAIAAWPLIRDVLSKGPS